MEGHEVKSFDALQTSNYPTAVRTQVIAIRSKVTEGNLSLNAYHKQTFDLFFIRNGKLMKRYLYWEPMSFLKNGYLDRDAKGWLGQVGMREYVCTACLERQGQGLPADPYKEIPTYALNKAAETGTPLDCNLCGCVLTEKLGPNGKPIPEMRPTPNDGLEEMMSNMVAGAPDKDILPKLFGVFAEDRQPGIWTPETEYEEQVAAAASQKKLSLLPFREFYNKQTTSEDRKGMILICKPFSVGPVDERDLYKHGRAKNDPANVRHFQQILLGEPEKRESWKSF